MGGDFDKFTPAHALAKRQPMGKLGTPPDVARLIAFLLSDDGVWTTGQLIHTDGGFSS